MNTKRLFILVIFSFILVHCKGDKNPLDAQNPDPSIEPPFTLTEVQKLVVKSSNEFGFDLFKEIAANEQDTRNIFISPLSVSLALGMTLNGANGQTQTDMEKTLGFEGMTSEQINKTYKELIQNLLSLDPKVIFEIANSIWYRNTYHVEQDFLDVNINYFDSEVKPADFEDPQTVNLINTWISDETHEKIDKVIEEIDPLTVMFLINALYFKGSWTYEFDPEDTKDAPFYLKDGTETTCSMMSYRMEHPYFENDDFQAIDLPYGDGDFSMMIIMPKPDKNIDNIITMITPENWASWLGSLTKDSIDLFLPRFKVEYNKKLKDDLSGMGMGIAFAPYQADFTKINKEGGLFINDVIHKTFVEVNEEGTEAAAVTVVEIQLTTSIGDEEEIIRMEINRPFIFVIYEHHYNMILFMAKIMHPVWE
jgi:serine protease inhibitor